MRLLPVLPYTFNVHIRWLYALIKGLKADLYFIFFCDATARCDSLRRICDIANTSQDVASLRKPHLEMCIYWFENTFEHLVVVRIGGASTGQPLRPGSAGLGNASSP